MSKFNCDCGVKGEWLVTIQYDDDANDRGWDGDEPLDPELEWSAYFVGVEFVCKECGVCDEYRTDGLGACWASRDAEGESYLEDIAQGMLPEEINLDDVKIQKFI